MLYITPVDLQALACPECSGPAEVQNQKKASPNKHEKPTLKCLNCKQSYDIEKDVDFSNYKTSKNFNTWTIIIC